MNSAVAAFRSFLAAHANIEQLDSNGQAQQAIAAALAAGPGTANGAFDTFDQAIQRVSVLTQQSSMATSGAPGATSRGWRSGSVSPSSWWQSSCCTGSSGGLASTGETVDGSSVGPGRAGAPRRLQRDDPDRRPRAPGPGGPGDPVAVRRIVRQRRGEPPAPGDAPRSRPDASRFLHAHDPGHGRLVAGVSADTKLFGFLNPFDGQIEGFDIDVLHQIAQSIFGDPSKIEYRAMTGIERINKIRTAPSTSSGAPSRSPAIAASRSTSRRSTSTPATRCW